MLTNKLIIYMVQLNFWITLDICNSLYLYVVNANE